LDQLQSPTLLQNHRRGRKLSKAAIKLRLGQPTLSAQLKQFEENIGIPLFDRQHKKLIITEQGKIALDYSKNIFRMGSEMYEVLHDRYKPLKHMLHIGALDSISKQVMLRLTKQALKISPCQVTLSEGNSDELLRELYTHRVDLVVTNFLPSGVDAKGLSPRLIAKNNIAIFGSPRFKALRKGFPQSISGQPLVFPTYDSKLRPDLDHWAKLNDIELNIVVESQDIAVKKLMAINEIGLIAAATHTVTKQILEGELVEIGKLKGVHEELYLLTAQRKIPNVLATELFNKFAV
jgi:LysR family transcriptional activator of nhaA